MTKLVQSNLTVSDDDGLTLKRIVPKAMIKTIANRVDTLYFCPYVEKSEGETLIFAGGMNRYPNKDAMFFFANENLAPA